MDNATESENSSITVQSQTTGRYITVYGTMEAGLAPLEVDLNADITYDVPMTRLSYFSSQPPGGVTLVEDNGTSATHYTVRITAPGLYYFTVSDNQTEDNESRINKDHVSILVPDRTELDTLLKGKWGGMKDALAQSAVNDAISWFDNSTKEVYTEAFTALSAQLPQIVQNLNNIQLLEMQNNIAKYDIRVFKNGNEFSYHLVFVKDKNGFWKIKAF
jgi:hypothetical protein